MKVPNWFLNLRNRLSGQYAMAVEGPLPWIGDVLAIQTPMAASNVRCLAQDLIGGEFHRTGIDGEAICSAIILVHVMKEPRHFMLGLALDVEYDGAALLDAYLADSPNLIATAVRISPECGAIVEKGLERYAKLDVEDRKIFLKKLGRCFKSYPYSNWDLDEKIVATEYAQTGRLLAASTIGVCTALLFLAGYRSWLEIVLIGVALVLWRRPFQRRVAQWIHPAELMARIRKRAATKYETLKRSRSFIIGLGRDECWSQSWMGTPKLEIDDHDAHWVRIVGIVRARVGTKSATHQFVLAFHIALDGPINEKQRDVWRRALDDEMLKADAALTQCFRAYGERARVKSEKSLRELATNQYRGLMKLPAASRYLGLTEKKLRIEVAKGRIDHKVVGDLPHFTKEWLDKYLRTPDGGPS